MRNEQGFTLIELLLVVAIIGILSGLAISSFGIYKASAAYSVADVALRNARTAAAAGLSNPDELPSAVALTSQSVQGEISLAAGRDYLPGMQIPKNLKFTFEFDPTCAGAACQAEYLEARHCDGEEFVRWIRYGDGTEVLLDKIAGSGCP